MMNKTFLLSALTGFVLVLVLGLPLTAQATAGTYNYIDERVATWNVHTGAYTNVTTTGYPRNNMHAYQAMSGNKTNTWKWKCNSSTAKKYYYHLWVAVPYNTGVLDGIYLYDAVNTDEGFEDPIPVNQEAYANQWVWIGSVLGTGGSLACYVTTNNDAQRTDFSREFWIDHLEYWPSSSVIPPAKTHKW